MAVVVHFSPPSLTAEQYDAVLARERELGVHPVDGLELEVCFGSGDQMKVTVVYESMEAMERHANGLTPILEDMRLDPGEPEIFETHNLIRRGE